MESASKTESLELIIKLAKESIPTVDQIIQLTLDDIRLTKENIKSDFSKSLTNFDLRATEIFMFHEKQAMVKLAREWLTLQGESVRQKMTIIANSEGWDKFINLAKDLFVDFALVVQKFEKDLGNMRKARGGSNFEKIVRLLLRVIDIKSEKPSGKSGDLLRRIDIVLPSAEIALQTPDRAAFLTCKRTLRERWKQEGVQARSNWRFYLITIDDDITLSKADEINDKGFIAFIRDDIVNGVALFKKPWIRNLNNLPNELERL